MRIIVTGATGMIGGIVLRRALADDAVTTVTSIGRRYTGVRHPKLRDIVHNDFTDFTSAAAFFADQDAALVCLGTYTGAVSDAELRRTTTDYAVQFARALHARSPMAAFCLLSGQGADQTGQSRMAFAKYKGEAEKAVLELDFPRVHLLRPGYIYPVTPRAEPTTTYRMFRALYPLVKVVWPNVGVSSEDLARVMLDAALRGTPGHGSPVLENADIRAMAAPPG